MSVTRHIDRRVGIDFREDGLYWAEAGGLRAKRTVRRSGRIAVEDEDQLRAALHKLRRELGTRAAYVVALRHGDLRHERLELPAMPKRDLRRIGRRRAAEFSREFGDDGVSATLLPRVAGEPVWLVAAPASASRGVFEWWRERGIQARSTQSHHLALAEVARFATERDPERLTAVLDVSERAATCVITDRFGWVFSREIPLKFAGERMLREERPDEFELDPLEEGVHQAERLHTELVRTFHYVQSQLTLGTVAHVVLCGDDHDLYSLSSVLATNLELPVQIFEQAVNLVLPAEHAAASAVAVGLSLSASQGDLLPSELKARARSAVLRRRLSVGLLASILVAVAVGAFVVTHATQLRRELAALQARREAQQERRQVILTKKQMRADAAALDSFWNRLAPPQPRISASLRTLGAALPPSLHVEHFRVEKRDERWRASIVVAADGSGTQSAEAVSRWSQQLAASPLYAVRDLTRAASAARDAGESLRFQVSTELAPVAARRHDLPWEDE